MLGLACHLCRGSKTQWFGWEKLPRVYPDRGFSLGAGADLRGGYVGLSALWGKEQRSIIADIGSRLGPGYVIAVFPVWRMSLGLGAQDPA